MNQVAKDFNSIREKWERGNGYTPVGDDVPSTYGAAQAKTCASMEVEMGQLMPTQEKKQGLFVSFWALGLTTAGFILLVLSTVVSAGPQSLSSSRSGGMDICTNPMYSKTTMKTGYDASFVALLGNGNTKSEKKFEASDIIVVDNSFYTVCDSNWALLKTSESLTPFSNDNTQIGDPQRDPDEDSGFEAIFHDSATDTFYIVRESIDISKGDEERYHAVVLEVKVDASGKDYTIERECVSELEFSGSSKGLEGALGLKSSTDGELYMLGLCEGNHCEEGSVGREKGNGKLVVMKKEENVDKPIEGYTCVWKTQRLIDIPEQAYFQDYSAISMNADGRVAITSQEESQIWLGSMTHISSGGSFDVEKSELSTDGAVVYDFPRDTNCETIYCNVEGIHWINDEMLVGVSDKMKKGGKQDFRCLQKDQSIHVFVLP